MKYGVLEDAVKKGSSNISLNKIKDDDGDYPVYGAKGFVQNISFFQQEEEYLAIIKDGAGIGRVSKYPAKSSVVATMQYLIPNKDFDIDFIRYFLYSIDFQKHKSGSTIPHIYFKNYKSEEFPILPLSEQKQIVKTLDLAFKQIDQAKANLEKNLNNAKELFASKLNEVFSQRGEGWEEKRLEELSNSKKAIVSGPFGSNLKVSDYRDSGVPIIRLQNVGKGYFIEKDIKYIEAQKAEELKSHSFVVGDIVLAKLGIPIGKTCIIPDSFSDGIILADIVRIRPDKEIVNYNFLEYFLNTSLSVSQLTKNISGATRPRVNLSNVRSIIVPVPPITIQNEIVVDIAKLEDNMKTLESTYQQTLNNLEELKKSILEKAFKGEL